MELELGLKFLWGHFLLLLVLSRDDSFSWKLTSVRVSGECASTWCLSPRRDEKIEQKRTLFFHHEQGSPRRVRPFIWKDLLLHGIVTDADLASSVWVRHPFGEFITVACIFLYQRMLKNYDDKSLVRARSKADCDSYLVHLCVPVLFMCTLFGILRPRFWMGVRMEVPAIDWPRQVVDGAVLLASAERFRRYWLVF
jgi:hypothetical protein